MKNKILGFLVMTMLILTSVIPITGLTKSFVATNSDENVHEQSSLLLPIEYSFDFPEIQEVELSGNIYTKVKLRKGEKLTADKIDFLRPNIAIGAEKVDEILNSILTDDVDAGTAIEYKYLTEK